MLRHLTLSAAAGLALLAGVALTPSSAKAHPGVYPGYGPAFYPPVPAYPVGPACHSHSHSGFSISLYSGPMVRPVYPVPVVRPVYPVGRPFYPVGPVYRPVRPVYPFPH